MLDPSAIVPYNSDLPHQLPSHVFRNIPHVQKRKFLLTYSQTGNLTQTCRRTDTHHSMHYYWLETDEAYAEAYDRAKQMAADYLESIAVERATREDSPSDTLLIFLLKGMLPHKYRESAQTQINVDRPMEVTIRRE